MRPSLLIRASLAAALGISTTAGALAAQAPPPDSVIRTAPIMVRIVRPVTTVGGASAVTVTVDSLHAGAAPTLDQVLREMPLVTVRTNSRGEAQFSLRGSGSDSRQVAVLLDGVPLNLGWDHRADLSVLPATAATSLTLVRGLPSVLYGPNVLGGVVELDVAHGAGAAVRRPAVEGRASVEHTGALGVAALASAPFELGAGLLSLRVGVGARDRPGTTVPAGAPGADADRLRANSDLSHVDAFTAARLQTPGGAWLTLASSGFRASRGIAPELHTQTPRFWRYPLLTRSITAVSGGTGDRPSPFGGRGDMEASLGVDLGRTEIESYRTGEYRDVVDTEEAEDRTLTLRLLADQTLGDVTELRTAFTFADIHHREVLGGTAEHTYAQRLWSAALETVWRLPLPGASLPLVRLSTGAVLDGADTPRSGDKPPLDPLTAWGGRIGAVAATSSGAWLWHAGLSRRARVPSLRELYSGALGRFAPNPLLRPEVLTAAEAGFTRHSGDVEVQVVAFHRELDGAIEQVTLPDRRRQRVNVGSIGSYGGEILASWTRSRFSAAGDLTVQRVTIPGTAAEPEYQPALMAGATLAATLPLDVRAGTDARFVGRQYCNDPDGPGQRTLAPTGRLDAHASRQFVTRTAMLPRIQLRAAADNVLDTLVYDQCGLPQPGRTLRLELRVF